MAGNDPTNKSFPNSGFDLRALTGRGNPNAAANGLGSTAIKRAVSRLQSAGTSAGRHAAGVLGNSMMENPVFHPHMLARFVPAVGTFGPDVASTTSRITKGYIIQKKGFGTGPGGGRYKLRFLFNPNDFTIEYLSAGGAALFANPAAMKEEQNRAVSNTPNMQTMQLNLLFDRTYELAVVGGALAKTPGPQDDRWSKGCYGDIEILEKMVGIEDGYGPVLPVPLDVVFGAPVVVKTARDEKVVGNIGHPLKFSGWSTGFSVSYTHFTYDMTPTRCAVAIGFSQVRYNDQNSTLMSPDAKAGESPLTTPGTDAGSDRQP